MSADTKIEWCDHTRNLWWGCTEVHEGCDHCYAREYDKRKLDGSGQTHWGAKTPRRAILGVWDAIRSDQRKAEKASVMVSTFCGSMMDIFERSMACIDHMGNAIDKKTGDLRKHFFTEVVPATPNVRWLLLTKRPGNILKMVPEAWLKEDGWPESVWTGCSVVNQKTTRDIVKLLGVPGRHFVSVEPLLGPVDLVGVQDDGVSRIDALRGFAFCDGRNEPADMRSSIDWVIVGGESGPDSRYIDINWIRTIRDQCEYAGVPVFIKQLGKEANDPDGSLAHCRITHPKGGDMSEWPEDLRVREFPWRAAG